MYELNLSEVSRGQFINITAIDEETAIHVFTFRVLQAGPEPVCYFRHKLPESDIPAGPIRVILEGCVNSDEPLDRYIEQEIMEENELTIPKGDGKLRVGLNIALYDQRPEPALMALTRHLLYPPISSINVTKRNRKSTW